MRPGLRRIVALVALLACMGTPGVLADDATGDRRDEWPPTYESPLADLLFLPIKILIRVGSVFEPKEAKDDAERSGSGEGKPRQ